MTLLTKEALCCTGKRERGRVVQLDHAHTLKEMDNASIALVHAVTLVITD
jgi:hypothetical protein